MVAGKLIRFRVADSDMWEIAFNERDLQAKLDGRVAEVIMPAKPWYIRMSRQFFPHKGIELKLKGKLI
jgi:hypothetical protein